VNGTIQIDAPDDTVGNALELPPARFNQNDALEENPCANGKKSSRFLIKRYAGKKYAPNNWRGACHQIQLGK
jgi:hypothetical protein